MSHRMIKDFYLTEDELSRKYDTAGQHPVIRLADWRRAVRDRRTTLGYWGYVHGEMAAYQNELDGCNPFNQLMRA